MKLNIKLTEKQEELLKQFATDHHPNSDKNCGTHNPLFVVETRRQRVVNPEYDSVDSIAIYFPKWGEEYSVDDSVEMYWEYEDKICPIEIKSFEDVYRTTITGVDGVNYYILDEEEYLKAYGVDIEYYVTYLGHYYEPVAYFFVREEAEKYIKYQKHNLTAPRVYAVGAGYANYGDYHHFYDLLMSIGTHLKESEMVEKTAD